MVNKNICDFTGTLNIELCREFRFPYIKSFDYIIDPRALRQGVLMGTYTLNENPEQNHSEIFNWSFISSFIINESDSIEYNVSQIFSDNYINNQFEGTWSKYNSEKLKTCNWGDYRIPNSGDLDIGAGGFSTNDQYLKFGWKTYNEAFILQNQNAREQKEYIWW